MPHDLPPPVSRRQMLRQCCGGFGNLALLGLMSSIERAAAGSAVNPLAARPPYRCWRRNTWPQNLQVHC